MTVALQGRSATLEGLLEGGQGLAGGSEELFPQPKLPGVGRSHLPAPGARSLGAARPDSLHMSASLTCLLSKLR